MNDQPQPEKVKSCLEASLKKDAQAAPSLSFLPLSPSLTLSPSQPLTLSASHPLSFSLYSGIAEFGS